MLEIAESDIGGARVRRTFTMGGERLFAGHMLTSEEVLALPLANRRALTGSNYLEVWPKAPNAAPANAERHIVSNGFGKFSVIVGHKLNEHPLTKDEAERLAKGD